MTPENVLVALLPPTVNVAEPAAVLSTVPPPDNPLIVSLPPFRSSVPVTLTLPLPTPSGMTPDAPSLSVPALIVVLPPYVFAPLRVNCDVALLSTTPVTLVPMMALMSVAPEPLPLLVIVPMLLTEVVDNVMPLAIELLLLMTRLPVPVTPPDTVSTDKPLALLFVSVVPPLFTVSAPLTVSADVVLFSVIPVTFEPTAALMSVVPLPAPILVIVPALLTAAVESVMVPVVALLLMVRLLVPVTPPLKVVEIAVPLFPMVSVPVVPLASTIGRAMVNPVVPTNSVALALPLVLPSVIVPAPKALALVVPSTVPDLIVSPPVNVFALDSVAVPAPLIITLVVP